jgi:hypothetical protein
MSERQIHSEPLKRVDSNVKRKRCQANNSQPLETGYEPKVRATHGQFDVDVDSFHSFVSFRWVSIHDDDDLQIMAIATSILFSWSTTAKLQFGVRRSDVVEKRFP